MLTYTNCVVSFAACSFGSDEKKTREVKKKSFFSEQLTITANGYTTKPEHDDIIYVLDLQNVRLVDKTLHHIWQ